MLRLESPARAGLIAACLLAVSALLPIPALAQWQPGGVSVCGDCAETVDDYFSAVPDGEGGVFVAWRRSRAGGSDLYLQRLTRDGVRAPGWPPDGVPLVVASGQQDIGDLVLDGSGGVYAIWTDSRDVLTTSEDVYAIRVLSSGAVAAGWPADGRVVSNATSSQRLPRGCSHGQGGVIVAWADYRNGSASAGTNPDVYAMHLMADGGIAPGWEESGIPVAADPGANEYLPSVQPDGAGGAYVAYWIGDPFGDIHVLRIQGNGALDPHWPVAGVAATTLQRATPMDVCTDGSGGVFIAWTDLRTYIGFPPQQEYIDVYATYLLSDGSFAPGWGVNGLPIAAKPGLETNVRVAEDGFGHFLVTWNDYTSGEGRSRATRVLRDGSLAPGWPADGALITTRSGAEFYSDICTDGSGGAFAVAESWDEDQHVIAQHFTRAGAIASGWAPEGLVMWPFPGHQSNPVVVPSPPGSAIVMWTDSRGTSDVYAQRLVSDGVVATALSLISAEATAQEVRVVGHSAGPAGELVMVERLRVGETWRVMASLTAPANGRIEYVDGEVSPGERLGYRLARGAGDAVNDRVKVDHSDR